jgi:nucleotide-binding universal stress UspA family protein
VPEESPHLADTDPPRHRSPFHDVLIAIDGSERPETLLTQASALAAPNARIALQAVYWRADLGPSRVGDRRPEEARAALDAARAAAEEARCPVEVAREQAFEPVELLRRGLGEHDLLVTAAPGGSRPAGIFLHTVSTCAAHLLPIPLLAVRPAPDSLPFPARVLVASDGSPESDWVVQAAAAIAGVHDGRVTLVHSRAASRDERHDRVLSQAAGLAEALGPEPVVRMEHAPAHHLVCEVARRERVSLIVMGSRRLEGVRALGSVSERVAHDAPCSVLTLPPEWLKPS